VTKHFVAPSAKNIQHTARNAIPTTHRDRAIEVATDGTRMKPSAAQPQPKEEEPRITRMPRIGGKETTNRTNPTNQGDATEDNKGKKGIVGKVALGLLCFLLFNRFVTFVRFGAPG
jgi:hypothetical protein